MQVTGAQIANISSILINFGFFRTLATFKGIISLKRSTREEANNIPFKLLLASGYSMRPKHKILFSLRDTGIKVSVLGGIKISVPTIT